MFLVDAHLDIAYNALRGRPVVLPASQQPPDDEGTPSVGLPDLRCGGAGLICATIFCEPDLRNGGKGYRTADEAHAMARQQLAWYHQQATAGELSIVTTAAQLPRLNQLPVNSCQLPGEGQGSQKTPVPTLLLLEGADALRSGEDVQAFFEAGLRIVGLAWKRTRLAGGTGDPGPLTPEGLQIVAHLESRGIIHDVSHLAEESFWNLLEHTRGPVMASHSNCRTMIPTDRHLSDRMIRALVERGAVIGINLYDKFLIPPPHYGLRRATLGDALDHIRHICQVVGNHQHVGLGTDMDGGFGREKLPQEITTWSDLPRLAELLASAGFDEAAIRGIMGENWLRFFQGALPG